MFKPVRNPLPLIFALFIIIFQVTILLAQDPPPEVIVCVVPDKSTVAPFTLTFRSPVHTGIVIPYDATITIYSIGSASASLYRIEPDAITGGYRKFEHIASVTSTTSTIPPQAEGQCPANLVPRLDGFAIKVAQPVRVNYSAMLAISNATGIAGIPVEGSVLGVFAFHFPASTTDIGSNTNAIDFQVIQLNDNDIEFRPPAIGQNVPLILIANKDVAVSEELKDGSLGNPRTVETRQFFKSKLQTTGYLLYKILEDGKGRFYPQGGLLDLFYTPGNYLKLSAMSPEAPTRTFTVCNDVKILDPEVIARYYALTNPDPNSPFGRLANPDATVKIDGIEQERLIIIDGNGTRSFIEAWLVQEVPGQCP